MEFCNFDLVKTRSDKPALKEFTSLYINNTLKQMIISFEEVQIAMDQVEALKSLNSKEKSQARNILHELRICLIRGEVHNRNDFRFIPVGTVLELQNKLRNKLQIITNTKTGVLQKKSVFILIRAIILKSEHLYSV